MRKKRSEQEIKDLRDRINFHYWDNGKSISWIAKNLATSLPTIHKMLLPKSEWEKIK